MDIYLFYCYLKFRYDNKKPFWIFVKNFPRWIWILLGLGFLGIMIGIFTYISDRGEIWRKIVLLVSLFCLGLAFIIAEHMQIKESKVRMENYWEYIKSIKSFLTENGIRSKGNIEVIMNRVQKKLDEEKIFLTKMRENDEKWMQLLAVPVVLAILTSFIGQQESLDEKIQGASNIIAIFVIAFLCLSGIIGMLRSIRKWKIENLTYFHDDLQAVLDLDSFQLECRMNKEVEMQESTR